MIKSKNKKAFTLGEVFVAMVIIAILGSVCIAFFKNRNDYSREYMYYSVYQSLVKVVDTIIDERPITHIKLSNEDPTDGFVNLCEQFCRKFNYKESGVCIGHLMNGVEFIQTSGAYTSNIETLSTVARINEQAYTLVVDIDGSEKGKNSLFYDRMPFYITEDGKVIPEFGTVSPDVRGYTSSNLDGGGNAALMSFDVVYTTANSNKLNILEGGRSVSFREAACKSGYVNPTSPYCQQPSPAITKSPTCTPDADCRIRLVKKLKWTR